MSRPVISLWWWNRSNFWVVWNFNEGVRENLGTIYHELFTLLAPGTGGMGCVCEGYQERATRRWPGWFWRNRWWNQHLKECPVERDEHGNVIRP